MDILNAIFQAIIQGLTEFLPVSSSGHLALFGRLFGSHEGGATFFTAVLHLGTLVAVFIAFRETISGLIMEFFRSIKDIFTGKFSFKNMNENRRMIVMLIISTLPLFVILPFKDKYDLAVAQGGMLLVGICFMVTAVLLFISDKCVKGTKTAKTMRYRDSVGIGVVQAIATLPGISRSGSTVATSLIFGLTKKTAVQYSFILGIPAILGAGVLEIKDAVELGMNIDWLPVVIGFVVAAVVGFFAIKLIAWLVKTDNFKWFGVYVALVGLFTIGVGVYDIFFK